jgi:hypothetical protein
VKKGVLIQGVLFFLREKKRIKRKEGPMVIMKGFTPPLSKRLRKVS